VQELEAAEFFRRYALNLDEKVSYTLSNQGFVPMAGLPVTQLLRAWNQGEDAALERLMPLVYDELRRIAHRYMLKERPGQTLQTTALVNEAYMRLVDARRVRWHDRAHFFAISAQLMRRILVDFARSRKYLKRGGAVRKVTFDKP
jgi:RNA polymerase sigma factor (TIGR02999 family)